MKTIEGAYLIILFAMMVAFGAYALSLGYNGTIIASLFTFGGLIAEYIYGKKTKEEPEESA